jgi:probable F420-dependent oxidoreductase
VSTCYDPRVRLKLRIGVMPGPWPPAADAGLFWRFVDACEHSEIDSIWFSERLTSPSPVLEPITAMAAVAARTRRLKFGPSVLVAPYRSPVLLARELAMLDYVSGGRALPAVGIGVGNEREFRAAGVPYVERGPRTDEAIRIMRACWTGAPVSIAGKFWTLEDVVVLPRPVQDPLPLWIGGNSEAAMRRAGRLGDGWIPSFITPEAFATGVAKTLHFAAEAGREIPIDHFGALVYFNFDRDPRRAKSAAAPFIPRGRVDDATLDRCAAFGPPDVLIDRLEAYVRGGGSKFIARPMGPPDAMLEQIAQLAETVVPLFHAR